MQGWLVVLELYDQVDLDISTGFERGGSANPDSPISGFPA
jgi:hypothetical protein